jgi:uncharacterized protein (TIGR02246 family)
MGVRRAALLSAAISLSLVLCACAARSGGSARSDVAAEYAAVEQASDSIAEVMAGAVSRRDAQALAWLYLEHPYAAFVSDGLRIPQSRIAEVIGASYQELDSLQFVWERKQTLVLSRDAAAMTAWAIYTSVDKKGNARRERAVYSHVIVRERGRWRFLSSHKSAVERLPIR